MKKVLTVIMVLLSVAMQAQTYRGGEIFRIKNSDIYWAAVKTQYFKSSVACQVEGNWCWAACVQMVMEYQKELVSQSDIVSITNGGFTDRTASGNQITNALNGWKGSSVKSLHARNPDTITEELSKGQPLIIGMEEHAYVLTHLFLTKSGNSYKAFKAILINKPKKRRRGSG